MSSAARPDSSIFNDDSIAADELFVALADFWILKALDVNENDLQSARGDAELVERLRVTRELLTELRDAGVLDTFFLLPKRDQADFVRLIGSTDDPGLRQRLATTLVSALAESPLALSDR